MKSSDGHLYFGGTSGFTVVNPKEVSSNSYQPRIILSDFLIDNVPTNTLFFSGNNSDSGNEIVLKYNQTNFGFKFASDNYLIPEKNKFKYRLKGYDNRWLEVDASNRTALYSKVPAGTYYFEIKASNNDNIWSEKATVIKIVRKPAPWLWWPAYTLYTLIGLAVLFLILRYYNDKKKLKLQLYLENIEKIKKEEIFQTQLRFYADISHDFKTPLSLILAALYKIKKDGLKQNYYDIMDSNTDRLLKLVNELMDFRTVENGKMSFELQQIDVNTFVEKIASDFVEYANEREINFEIKTAPSLKPVCIDKNILEKIIMNLLNNSFKHTDKNGSVSIEILPTGDSFNSEYSVNHVIAGNDFNPENSFGIVIRDTGVGIPEKSITDVFERYFKINTTTFDPQLGTGIGLALTKNLVLLHKGKLSISSEQEKGTDVEIRFPANEKPYEPFISQNEKTDQDEKLNINFTENLDSLSGKNEIDKLMKDNKKRILLVEDHNELRMLIADTLSEDYTVEQAEDGVVASEMLKKIDFNLIVSDIMMPNKDGIAFSKEVKNNAETSHIPIILLTAKSGIGSKIEGADSGADIYLEKPVDCNLLKLTVENIFKQQQQLREYYAKNYFANDANLSSNEQDNKFLKHLVKIINDNLCKSDLNVNFIASQMSMSRSKLYNKVKTLTEQSIIEFILNQRLMNAARLIIEENMTMRQVMEEVGIESQAYFTNTFKKKFGNTPTAFATKHKKANN